MTKLQLPKAILVLAKIGHLKSTKSGHFESMLTALRSIATNEKARGCARETERGGSMDRSYELMDKNKMQCAVELGRESAGLQTAVFSGAPGTDAP